jgi:DNA-binding response OmpR family regulator
LYFDVIDTGMGIPETSIDKIFSVFYREKDQESFVSESTGLGLSLTKSLVEVMGGKIIVESQKDKGSTFSVQIPLDDKQLEITGKRIEPRPIVTEEVPNQRNIISPSEIINTSEINVLIVEDNLEVIEFLENELKLQYQVHKAFNGKDGFDKAIEIIPEIIISDVMMPEMDGKELCRKLKLDIRTSHIPIILLTAKQSDEYRIEGYGVGADEYLSKPFNPMVLKARILNLLVNRARLRELFSKENNFEVSLITNNQTDTEFLKQVIQIIETNIGNYEFDIDLFANELKLGRSIFFKKIKALTNQTPHMLVTAYRMKKAAEYLSHTNNSISEIAYEVGFNEPSNFTRTFTRYFNMSPSKYIEIYKK